MTLSSTNMDVIKKEINEIDGCQRKFLKEESIKQAYFLKKNNLSLFLR